MAAFDGYLLLLPGGAGGHLATAERAQAAAARLAGAGWLFGARDGGHARGRRRRRGGGGAARVVRLTLLTAIGSPDPRALAAALEEAGRRHGRVYEVVAWTRPAEPGAAGEGG